MSDDEKALVIAEAIRVAYLRGAADPSKENMTETIWELRDFVFDRLFADGAVQ